MPVATTDGAVLRLFPVYSAMNLPQYFSVFFAFFAVKLPGLVGLFLTRTFILPPSNQPEI
jgi:hypothetical protein